MRQTTTRNSLMHTGGAPVTARCMSIAPTTSSSTGEATKNPPDRPCLTSTNPLAIKMVITSRQAGRPKPNCFRRLLNEPSDAPAGHPCLNRRISIERTAEFVRLGDFSPAPIILVLICHASRGMFKSRFKGSMRSPVPHSPHSFATNTPSRHAERKGGSVIAAQQCAPNLLYYSEFGFHKPTVYFRQIAFGPLPA